MSSALACRNNWPADGKASYLQQPGEPLFLLHEEQFSASTLQHCSVPFSSPHLSQRSLAQASEPQEEAKARHMDDSDINGRFFIPFNH